MWSASISPPSLRSCSRIRSFSRFKDLSLIVSNCSFISALPWFRLLSVGKGRSNRNRRQRPYPDFPLVHQPTTGPAASQCRPNDRLLSPAWARPWPALSPSPFEPGWNAHGRRGFVRNFSYCKMQRSRNSLFMLSMPGELICTGAV